MPELESQKKKDLRSIGMIAVAAVAALVVYAGFKSSPSPSAIQSQPQQIPTKVVADPPVAEAPSQAISPPHNYSMVQDREYGYERALSENDKNSGLAAASLVMVRFLGESNGTYSAQMSDGNSKLIFSCSDACEFIKSKTYYAGSLIKTETVRSVDGSILHAVMQDAMTGQLLPTAPPTRISKKKFRLPEGAPVEPITRIP